MSHHSPEIRVENLSWSVGTAPILDAVTCHAPSRRFTGLIGPNGSGKTSLLSAIAHLTRPDDGTVLIGGEPAAGLHRREFARTVALVEQHSATDLELTVEQIVELGMIPRRGGWARPAPTGSTDVVTESLAMAGIAALRHRLWQSLSGGERQKTQLARAFAQQPCVLLLDEPTNHLDVSASLELLDLIRARGLTTVAAMHDLNLAAMYCDHLVVLDRGRVVTEGAPDTVLTEQLLADVYGIDAIVQPHPRTGRPMVVLCGTTGAAIERLSS
ncbi:ABC transporter ATP-binding protein [Rhodococcus sp. SGAir0479]|uniref:ABC transporter ATP-binding protein n=1 Tax=Rhodococcus sp. SGAir0479 TaxID=2567884 RepID=UPI0010CD1BAF|nr:ABC transporter ATP-binding protein [Rhodococcus sp. SGAir0479]QCQ89767.1 ABC transporter ATP-binding protein [Rhodococcus sp. SGAir0479]